MASEVVELQAKIHARYFKFVLRMLPAETSNYDQNRITIVYFALQGLDVLGALDSINKQELIDWIYSLQVLPDKDNPELNAGHCGFRGGTFAGAPYNAQCEPCTCCMHDFGHVAHSYAALNSLIMLGDNLERVNKAAIISSLKTLQKPDGSYQATFADSENDMRFLFCAAAVSHHLQDFSGIDIEAAVRYVIASQSFDGGIAQGPGQESHGGSTYCAVAALKLLGRLDDLPMKEDLIQWLVKRQDYGFQGRTHKKTDVCYSFWVGASLAILGASEFVDVKTNRDFTLAAQGSSGGIAKWPNHSPDPLHTCMGLNGLSLLGGDAGLLLEIVPELGLTRRAVESRSQPAVASV